MNRYLLDTNHAGRLLRDDQQLWARLRTVDNAEFGLCRPSVGELWFMVLNSAQVDGNRYKLEALLQYFVIWELDVVAAVEFGQIRVELARQGRPIPQIDVQIAAIARVNDLTLLTSDKHFRNVQNLKMEDWLSPTPR
jgi:tRNA(fMet)-specific endonuclease VapC